MGAPRCWQSEIRASCPLRAAPATGRSSSEHVLSLPVERLTRASVTARWARRRRRWPPDGAVAVARLEENASDLPSGDQPGSGRRRPLVMGITGPRVLPHDDIAVQLVGDVTPARRERRARAEPHRSVGLPHADARLRHSPDLVVLGEDQRVPVGRPRGRQGSPSAAPMPRPAAGRCRRCAPARRRTGPVGLAREEPNASHRPSETADRIAVESGGRPRRAEVTGSPRAGRAACRGGTRPVLLRVAIRLPSG